MENNNEYTWTMQEWWNHDGSFWRIQYSSTVLIDNIWELSDLFELWIYYLDTSAEKTRLDMRFVISKSILTADALSAYKKAGFEFCRLV